MPAVKVKVFCAFVVPHLAPLALYDVDVEKRVYII